MEQTERSETLAFNLQALVNHPAESTQHSQHVKSSKSGLIKPHVLIAY
jgi:hypothetical protein